jgi:hypothetical protein
MRKWLKQADGDDIKMVLSGGIAVTAFCTFVLVWRPRRRNAAGIATPSSRPLTGDIEAAKIATAASVSPQVTSSTLLKRGSRQTSLVMQSASISAASQTS